MSKKIILVLAALLFVGVSQVYATNIPQAVDAKSIPVVWTEEVYNGSGSDIGTATVVQWDFSSSDSDENSLLDKQCNWVKTVDAADDIWTAGVTLASAGISNGSVGPIIIRGPAVVQDGSATTLTASQISGSESTGVAGDFAGGGADNASLGVVIAAGGPGKYAGCSLIYIYPSIQSDD